MFETISYVDEKVLLVLNQNHSSFFDSVMLAASNFLSLIPVFLLITYVVHHYVKAANYHPVANVIVFVLTILSVSLFCSEVLPKVFSIFMERERPCVNPNLSEWVRLLGENCHPDSTAPFAVRPCIYFCISSFLYYTIKERYAIIKILLVFLALLVSYSRIYVGAQYPSSVLIADVTGILFGYIGSRVYFYLTNHFFVF